MLEILYIREGSCRGTLFHLEMKWLCPTHWASWDSEMLLLHQHRFSGIVILTPPSPPQKKTPRIHTVIGSMDSPIITLHSQDFFWQMEYSVYTAWKVLFSHAFCKAHSLQYFLQRSHVAFQSKLLKCAVPVAGYLSPTNLAGQITCPHLSACHWSNDSSFTMTHLLFNSVWVLRVCFQKQGRHVSAVVTSGCRKCHQL